MDIHIPVVGGKTDEYGTHIHLSCHIVVAVAGRRYTAGEHEILLHSLLGYREMQLTGLLIEINSEKTFFDGCIFLNLRQVCPDRITGQ